MEGRKEAKHRVLVEPRKLARSPRSETKETLRATSGYASKKVVTSSYFHPQRPQQISLGSRSPRRGISLSQTLSNMMWFLRISMVEQ